MAEMDAMEEDGATHKEEIGKSTPLTVELDLGGYYRRSMSGPTLEIGYGRFYRF